MVNMAIQMCHIVHGIPGLRTSSGTALQATRRDKGRVLSSDLRHGVYTPKIFDGHASVNYFGGTDHPNI